jgi:hypothetical protein
MSETITFDVEFKNFSSKMLREIEQAGHGFEDVVADAMAKGADAGLGKAMPAFAKDLRKAWGSATSEIEAARKTLSKAAKMDAGIVRAKGLPRQVLGRSNRLYARGLVESVLTGQERQHQGFDGNRQGRRRRCRRLGFGR